jgi:hypothetical protein
LAHFIRLGLADDEESKLQESTAIDEEILLVSDSDEDTDSVTPPDKNQSRRMLSHWQQ